MSANTRERRTSMASRNKKDIDLIDLNRTPDKKVEQK